MEFLYTIKDIGIFKFICSMSIVFILIYFIFIKSSSNNGNSSTTNTKTPPSHDETKSS